MRTQEHLRVNNSKYHKNRTDRFWEIWNFYWNVGRKNEKGTSAVVENFESFDTRAEISCNLIHGRMSSLARAMLIGNAWFNSFKMTDSIGTPDLIILIPGIKELLKRHSKFLIQ